MEQHRLDREAEMEQRRLDREAELEKSKMRLEEKRMESENISTMMQHAMQAAMAAVLKSKES